MPICDAEPCPKINSTAPARRSTRVALLAGAVAHHGEVGAFQAHIAGIALHDRLHAAVNFLLLGGLRLGLGGVGE